MRCRFHHHLGVGARARCCLGRAPASRVDGRPYDATLYMKLVRAAPKVLGLPQTPMYLTVGLSTTIRLAGYVARNADDAAFAALIDEASTQQPLAIAVTLIRELMFMARKTQRPDLESESPGACDKAAG